MQANTDTDMMLKCKGREFRVHKEVACQQSKPIAAAIDGKWKVGVANLPHPVEESGLNVRLGVRIFRV